MTPPIAACTVALGIHENAIKNLSFLENLVHVVARKVASHRKIRPTTITKIELPIM